MHVLGEAEVLTRIRKLCLALPETSERLSHGAPTFFVRGKRAFLMVLTDHHGDGRFAIWCAAPAGMQKMLVDADPERFFVPPYVGHRGWLGVRLDRGVDWDELAGIADDAYAEVAPERAELQQREQGAARDPRLAIEQRATVARHEQHVAEHRQEDCDQKRREEDDQGAGKPFVQDSLWERVCRHPASMPGRKPAGNSKNPS